MMKSCIHCGTEFIAETKYCPECGNKVDFHEETSASAPQDDFINKAEMHEEKPVSPTMSPSFTWVTSTKRTIFQRVINLMTQPTNEWKIISSEEADFRKILIKYILPLSLIPALALFLLYAVIGITSWGVTTRSFETGIIKALIQILGSGIIIYAYSIVIEKLAPSFESEADTGRSFQLAAYSITPVWVLGILNLVNVLGTAVFFISVFYSAYLMKKGLPVIKKTPEDKVTGFMVLSLISYVIIYYAVGFVFKIIVKIIL
jgi:hypothetical protein